MLSMALVRADGGMGPPNELPAGCSLESKHCNWFGWDDGSGCVA